MKKLISYLQLNQMGFLEIMLALFPIVTGYAIGPIRFGIIWVLIMDIIAFFKKKGLVRFPLLYVLFGFVILHEIFVLTITGAPSEHLNYIISMLVWLTGIMIIAPALDINKLIGSFNLMGIIVCIGLFYHFTLMVSGQIITPIKLPLLPTPDLESRLFEEGNRPCSFFWEPAAFVTYMMIPLFVSMTQKKWLLMVSWLFFIFLSTSTNGIILAPIMIVVYVLSQKGKFGSKLFYIVVVVGMAWFLNSSDIFEFGKNKMLETEVETNARLSNGPLLVAQMPTEHIIFGLPEHDLRHYLSFNNLNVQFFSSNNGVFLSDFWRVLVSYGIFGLFLYLLVYFRLIRLDKTLLPYIIALYVAMFSQGLSFSSTYLFQLCFMYCWIKNNPVKQLEKNKITK